MIETRYHSLDAVRAWALLAGIVLHATMSFLPAFQEVRWPIVDVSQSDALSLLFFVIHIFRMALFFIIAGFFARLLHQRLGSGGLLKNRLRRVGLPLIAAMVVVSPLVFVAILWGMHQAGTPPGPPRIAPPPFIGPPVPWGHLWFLYLLLVLNFLVVLLRAAVTAVDGQGRLRGFIGRCVHGMLRQRFAPLLLAAPLAALLTATPWWQPWHGIPAPIVGLVPSGPSLIAFGGAFLLGWFLHREQDALGFLARDWLLYLVLAVLGTAAAWYLDGFKLSFTAAPLSSGSRAAYAFAYCFALWCWCFAVIGFGLRFLGQANARWRYLADASYWMYLVHLPIVWLLQAWMMRWPLHWGLKFTFIICITGVVLLASYRWLVRGSFIGVFLNGRRHPQPAIATSVPNTSPG